MSEGRRYYGVGSPNSYQRWWLSYGQYEAGHSTRTRNMQTRSLQTTQSNSAVVSVPNDEQRPVAYIDLPFGQEFSIKYNAVGNQTELTLNGSTIVFDQLISFKVK